MLKTIHSRPLELSNPRNVDFRSAEMNSKIEIDIRTILQDSGLNMIAQKAKRIRPVFKILKTKSMPKF